LISYADLVTLLFALFVLLYAASDRDRARAVAAALAGQIRGQMPQAESPAGGRTVLPGAEALPELRQTVEQSLSQNKTFRDRARVRVVERGFVISLAEAGFFAPGEAAMRDEGRKLIDAIVESLRPSQALIRVEGHTDSLPIATVQYPSNWDLSSARASAVLAELVARKIPPSRLSVAGYASHRPVADNATPEGRALNRRVDLVILPAEK
jgi:chemotaxis protein MotB